MFKRLKKALKCSKRLQVCTRVTLCVAFAASLLFTCVVSPQSFAAGNDALWLEDMEAESTNVTVNYGTAPNGGTINIGNNVEFDHGISMHPPLEGGPAEAEFNIEGLGYRTFVALGGKDLFSGIEVGGAIGIKGTKVGMEVWVDGVKKAESGNIPYPETYLFKVDITGAKKLKLVVTDGGDTIYFDTTSFAGARLFKQAIDDISDDMLPQLNEPDPTPTVEPTPPATPDPALKDADKAYISDLPWVDYLTYTTNDEMPEHRDENNSGEEIWICGEYYEKGVCLHARPNIESYLDVNIEGLGFTTFAAYVGMAESMSNDVTMGSCAFVVYADGVEKARTDVMKAEDEAKLLTVDITDCKILRLAITDGGDGISGDWGTFASALIGRTDDVDKLFETPAASQTPAATQTTTPSKEASPTPVSTPSRTTAKTTTVPASSVENENGNGWLIPVIIVAVVVVIAAVVIIIILAKRRNKNKSEESEKSENSN